MGKPACTAVQLHRMLVERIEAVPDLKVQGADVRRGCVLGTGSDNEVGGPN
ncbi:hypothetical protein [Variovorax sp. 38R]|uniref:hypothetical protein n=1 Tax=Variovorax sp. 38R TaxID=2774875 RepID=UPI001CE04989|nr:hypothetical protein [Variovorax sp. 38R]